MLAGPRPLRAAGSRACAPWPVPRRASPFFFQEEKEKAVSETGQRLPKRTVRRAPPARKPSPPSSAANSEQERWDKRERESWPTLAAARRPTVAAWRRQLPSRILVDFCGRTRYKEEEEEEEEEASRT
ncbi:unnamed protein product [Prorocentrum cordatum]|uniref:Uncharacterized protein n=1 Tax=Prorocentrum cordatum TaxID=2364126 RepID=A0ABN9W833_9DINO|nr:unnamed protein product [Polarella glacialis]